MTRDEIIAAIDAKIAGQGNQIDAGSVLPEILKGIISLVETKASKAEVDDFEEFDEATSYVAGDIVRHDDKLYKFTDEHTGAWNPEAVVQECVVTIVTAEQK